MRRLIGILMLCLACCGLGWYACHEWLAHDAKVKYMIAQAQQVEKPQVNAQALSSVLFVGCPSEGMMGPSKAPYGKPKLVSLPHAVAEQLAYYKAKDGQGVLAPRGWHCFRTSGSAGSWLVVAPQIVDGEAPFGPVVKLSVENAETSGRFMVASVIARVFPAYRAFVSKVIEEGIEPAADFPLVSSYPLKTSSTIEARKW